MIVLGVMNACSGITCHVWTLRYVSHPNIEVISGTVMSVRGVWKYSTLREEKKSPWRYVKVKITLCHSAVTSSMSDDVMSRSAMREFML